MRVRVRVLGVRVRVRVLGVRVRARVLGVRVRVRVLGVRVRVRVRVRVIGPFKCRAATRTAQCLGLRVQS